MTSDNDVEKSCSGKKIEKAIYKAKTGLAIGAMIATPLLQSCQEEEKPKPEQHYTLTIEARSSIDKKIQDGTIAYFVATGSTDTAFAATRDEQATIKLLAKGGRSIDGTAGLKENPGHDATHQRTTIKGDKELHLTMDAKRHRLTINYRIRTATAPVSKAIIATPQDTTRTDKDGKGSITIDDVTTDEYNNIQHQLTGSVRSDNKTSIPFSTQTFTYHLTRPTTEKEITVKQEDYKGTITVDDNIANATIYAIHEKDTVTEATADDRGDATLTIEREENEYEVTVGAKKKGYAKDEKSITLEGNNDYRLTLNLTPAKYKKTININISSSEPTKTPKSFRGYVLIAGDTITAKDIDGTKGTLEYETDKASETAEVGATNIPAHKDVKKDMTLTGTHDLNATASIEYQNSTLPVTVKGERGKPVNDVKITGFGDDKKTDDQGKATLEMILGKDKTDKYGLPFNSYTTTITLASDGIINKNTAVDHAAGANDEQSIGVKRTSYPYTLTIKVTSSNPEKTPLRSRDYVLVAGDTITAKDIDGTKGTLTFTNTAPTLKATIGAKNIPYHSDAAGKEIALDGEDDVTLTAKADVSYYNISGRVSEEGTNNGVQAKVAAEGKNDDTDANGDYAIEHIERRRDENNKPLTYTIDITATGDFTTQTKNATANGENINVNFSIPQNIQDYTLTGKIVNDRGDDRFRNVTNALRIRRSDGEEVYASTDANGEFNKNLQAKPGEKLEVSINIPGQQERTLSIIYDPQKSPGQGLEYPKNRLVETSWDLYRPDSAFVTPEELSKLPLTIITLSDDMAANDTLRWIIEGSENVNAGVCLYVGNQPINKYIYTVNVYTGEPMTQAEIDKTIIAMNKTEALLNRPEIGPLLPFEDHFTISATKPPDGINRIYMFRSGMGYYNATLYASETQPKYVGWYARGPSAIKIDGYVEELIAPSARDAPAESGITTDNYYVFTLNADTIAGLSNIGKVVTNWNNNSEPGIGSISRPQQDFIAQPDWDANIHDWKTTPYLAMNKSSDNTNLDEAKQVESLGVNDTPTWDAAQFIDDDNGTFTGEGEIIRVSSWTYQPADCRR